MWDLKVTSLGTELFSFACLACFYVRLMIYLNNLGNQFQCIVTVIAGGESVAENCQILQTRVNRFKSDKNGVDPNELKGYSCEVTFTGIFLFS